MNTVEGHASSALSSEAKPLKGRMKILSSTSAILGQGELNSRPDSSLCSHRKQFNNSLVSSKASRLENPQQEKPSMALHFRLEREKSSHLGSAKRNWQPQEHPRLLHLSCCSTAACSRLVEWNLSCNSRHFPCQLFVVGGCICHAEIIAI